MGPLNSLCQKHPGVQPPPGSPVTPVLAWRFDCPPFLGVTVNRVLAPDFSSILLTLSSLSHLHLLGYQTSWLPEALWESLGLGNI